MVGLGFFFNNLLLNEKFGNFWEMGKLVFYNWILVALGNTPLVLSPKIFPQGDKQDEAKCQVGSWAVLSLKPRSKSTLLESWDFPEGLPCFQPRLGHPQGASAAPTSAEPSPGGRSPNFVEEVPQALFLGSATAPLPAGTSFREGQRSLSPAMKSQGRTSPASP